ncbi:MAG: RHS repeat-associated core domain-containing protein, partial [Bacteroidota bacterium]
PDPVAGLDVVQVVRGYYPFGARHGSDLSTVAPPENQYLYNGKEMQDELNLGWYDYGARMYDPTIGRWNGVDALAEFRSEMSPFNYVSNSPLNRIDPDGRLDTRTVAMNAYMTTPDGQNARFTRSKSDEEEPEDDFVEVEYLEMVAMDPTTGNHTFTRREFQHEYVEEPYVSRATGAIRYKTRRKYKGYVEYEVVVSPDGKIISAKKIEGNKETEMTLSEVMHERSDFALLVYDSSSDITTGNKKKSYNYEGYYNLGYHHLENGTVLDDFNNLSGGVAIGTGFIDKMVSSGNLSL